MNRLFIAALFCLTIRSYGNTDTLSNPSLNITYPPVILDMSMYFKGNFRDSVFIWGNDDTTTPYYSKVTIRRKGKVALSLNDTLYRIKAFQGSGYTEFICGEVHYYIFRLFDPPAPDAFRIISATKDTIISFGIIPNSTADIYGDIDRDGIFEIGGYNGYDPDASFTVREIRKGLPIDSTLTNSFIETLRLKSKTKALPKK